MFKSNKKEKVFCIGQNKTGTTSLEAILKSLNYKIADQAKGELLLKEWSVRNFKNIIKLCKTADAFQDIPFSNDFTYIVLDQAFPKSKFILTIRNNKDEWYNSLINFHTKIIGNGKLPTAEDLKKFDYRYKGFLFDAQSLKYGITEDKIYDYELYTKQYELHNTMAIKYFQHRPNDLLVLNLSDDDAMKKLYDFLGHEFNGEKAIHLNRTKEE